MRMEWPFRFEAAPGAGNISGPASATAAQTNLVAFHPLPDIHTIFEQVVRAYADRQLQRVRNVLSSRLYSQLSLEILEREQAGHVLHSELVKFVAAELLEPEEQSKLRRIEMRCISRMIVALKDADGRILAGDPEHVRCLSEVWTLERPAGSSGWVVTSIEEDE